MTGDTEQHLPREDFAALRRFLAGVDQWMRLVGPQRMSDGNVFIRSARYSLFTHADWSEMSRLVQQLRRYSDWYPTFSTRANELLDVAEAACAAGHDRTAGEHYLRAAGLYHASQIGLTRDDLRKAEGGRSCIEVYARGAAFFDPPARRVEIPTSAGSIPGYLRQPPGKSAASPTVLMLNGANSVKEELHYFADYFLRRGMATLTIDGPGQGELATVHGHPGLRIDVFEQATSEVLDWLAERPEVDGERIALWGLSWGGFLALRIAARAPRLRAAVSLGGFYDFREIDNLGPWLLEEFSTLLGLRSFAETAEYVRANCTLADAIQQIRCPYVVVHGALDDLLGVPEAEEMVRGANVPAELWVYEDGVHGCYNRGPEVGARMGDWLSATLTGQAAGVATAEVA